MTKYQGHPSWNKWNVSLWLDNDYETYTFANLMLEQHGLERAAIKLHNSLPKRTPDGAEYNLGSLRYALQSLLD